MSKVNRNFSIALWDLWERPKGEPFFFVHSPKNTDNSFWSKHETYVSHRNTLDVEGRAVLASG